jgi:hypothetical protein
MFENNQELIYYSLLHQLLFFLPHLDVKLQRQSLYRYIHKDSLDLGHLALVKLFILFITEIMQIILSLIQCE